MNSTAYSLPSSYISYHSNLTPSLTSIHPNLIPFSLSFQPKLSPTARSFQPKLNPAALSFELKLTPTVRSFQPKPSLTALSFQPKSQEPEPDPHLASKEMATGNTVPARPKPKLVAENSKSNSSADQGKGNETMVGKKTNNSASKSAPYLRKAESTPDYFSRPSLTRPLTPLKKNPTSSQYYAGPAFLNSPSPKSLPKPRILSKPGPDGARDPKAPSSPSPSSSPKSAMANQTENLPPPVGREEDSPTLRKSKLGGESKDDASAAQDFFIQGSLLKSLQAGSKDDSNTATDDSGLTSPSPFLSRPASFPSSPANRVSYHVRNSTEGSTTGGLMRLEMDDPNSPSAKLKRAIFGHDRPPLSQTHSDSFTPRVVYKPMSEELRKQKSIELKRYLLSLSPQKGEVSATAPLIRNDSNPLKTMSRLANSPAPSSPTTPATSPAKQYQQSQLIPATSPTKPDQQSQLVSANSSLKASLHPQLIPPSVQSKMLLARLGITFRRN